MMHQATKHRVSIAEEQKAVALYGEERARFARHMEPFRVRPEHRVMLTHMRIVPGTYYYRRDAFYRLYGWAPLPYVWGLYPRYGLYDAVFLAFMLDHIAEQQYALMYYNHMNEPEFVQWRQQMDQLAMQNADLRARLTAMDQQIAGLQGRPVDPSYVPQDAQDIALSPDVIDGLTAANQQSG
jgi:hypothetical protein